MEKHNREVMGMNLNDEQIYMQNPDYVRSGDPRDFEQHIVELSKYANGAFPYTDFQVKDVESDATQTKRALIQFQLRGQPYGLYADYRVGYANGPCLQRVNRALADATAPGRFYELEHPAAGYAYLTPAQVVEIEREQSIRVRRRNEIETWTTRQITEYVNKLQDAGLLDHLESYRVSEISQKILWIDLYSRLQLWKAIPELVYHFDTERISDPPNDYIQLIRQTALISHGVFKPEKLAAQMDDAQHVRVEFDYERKRFGGSFYINDDWVDMEYLRLLNIAIQHVHGATPGKFCTLDTGGQDAVVIFLTFGQFALAEIGELLPHLHC
jgi:hypothetical protein